MADVEVIGKRQFIDLAVALKAQGADGRGLKRELTAKLKVAAKPMEAAVLSHVALYLPSGYAPIMAAGLVVRPSQSTRTGLKLTGYAKGKARRRFVGTIDRGTLRHPVYGNREAWVNQRVKAGFWSEPLSESDEPIKAIREAVQETIDKLGRG
jgi:hypothetical protein